METKQKVTKENINELMAEWVKSDLNEDLLDVLGLTWEQFAHWMKTGELPTE